MMSSRDPDRPHDRPHHHKQHKHHHKHRHHKQQQQQQQQPKTSREEEEGPEGGDTSEPGPGALFFLGETDEEGGEAADVASAAEATSDGEAEKPDVKVKRSEVNVKRSVSEDTTGSGELETVPESEDYPNLAYSDTPPRHLMEKARHHHTSAHGMSEDDLKKRRRRGSEMTLQKIPSETPTDHEEADTLAEEDLDNMASHRFYDIRGLRKRKLSHHSAMASVVHIADTEDGKGAMKKTSAAEIDHSPHDMFVELEELYVGDDAKYAWQETARWIKYEEDLEEGADRFGKPHVAMLSFHSLLELRRCIEQGVILLDLADDDLPSIVTRVVDALVTSEQLPDTAKGPVIQALLLKHRHVEDDTTFQEKMRGMRRGSLRSVASFGSLKSAASGSKMDTILELEDHQTGIPNGDTPDTPEVTWQHDDNHLNLPDTNNHHGDRKASTVLPAVTVTLEESQQRHSEVKKEGPPLSKKHSTSHGSGLLSKVSSRHSHILSRIPEGAEATTVLVGSVEFLDKPVMAFVRLARGAILGNLTEVPLPVRFLFMLMGPPGGAMDYHEIGRSISTLMCNKSFHDIAYRADDRDDLLGAINEFLDDSLVLPPGEIEKDTLLPVMHMAKRKQLERKAKMKKEAEAWSLRRKDKAADDIPMKEKLPPSEKEAEAEEEDDNPLRRTKRPFGGLIRDVKRRYPKYLSDIKDGLNLQCLGVFFFIFFACLSPAITFGGLLGEKTDQWIGVSEMLIATSIFGIIFSLFSAQPLTIIGATGPIVIFEEGLHQICDSLGFEFLPTRFWVLAWMTVIAAIVVAFEGTVFVQYFTLFTEEIFSFLISLIFIYEVFKKLYNIFVKHPISSQYYMEMVPDTSLFNDSLFNTTFPASTVSSLDVNTTSWNVTSPWEYAQDEEITNQPNTALLSLILTMSTFALAYFLKEFRNSKFLGRSARRALGDFGVPISIAIMVLVDYAMREVYTEKLNVPDGLEPTASYKRGWFINPLGMEKPLPWWVALGAAIPGTLIFILIFIETQITSLIINKKERNMTKGSGFHLDIFLIGVFASFSGLFGVPLLGAASVRSISHVSALTQYSRTHAPGEKPKLLGVTEQRLTSFCVHIMIGISVLMGPVLRQVPLAVLFGIFLYMGVASLSGVQLFDRILLFFIPVKHHPDVGYVRHVMTKRMHLFTIIQVLCLGLLWAVKSTAAALSFPFVLLLTVPLRRYLLPFIFQDEELKHLDRGDENGEDSDIEDEDEPDFYVQSHRM